MLRSAERILTSHVGSLSRPADLQRMVQAHETPEGKSDPAFGARLREAVDEVVRAQRSLGLDIVNDGEFGKLNFFQYLSGRLGGLAPGDAPLFPMTKERKEFPDYYARQWGGDADSAAAAADDAIRRVTVSLRNVACIAPLSYTGLPELQRDIENLKAALSRHNAPEGFYASLAPTFIETVCTNRNYGSTDDFLVGAADALRIEYQTIVSAGLLLQIDAPDLTDAYNWWDFPEFESYRSHVARRVEIINYALRGIPAERVRVHMCWGSWNGPHIADAPLAQVVDVLTCLNVGCISIEAATVRHAMDWRVWENFPLPESMILMPGVVSHHTDSVEPPELVAHALVQYGKILGRERVIAGTDCGMTRAADPTIARLKFQSMVEGARLASKALWGQS
jgi:5-methyltetrahydropteroyltriglutamate--homocysteine methyltransferase